MLLSQCQKRDKKSYTNTNILLAFSDFTHMTETSNACHTCHWIQKVHLFPPFSRSFACPGNPLIHVKIRDVSSYSGPKGFKDKIKMLCAQLNKKKSHHQQKSVSQKPSLCPTFDKNWSMFFSPITVTNIYVTWPANVSFTPTHPPWVNESKAWIPASKVWL